MENSNDVLALLQKLKSDAADAPKVIKLEIAEFPEDVSISVIPDVRKYMRDFVVFVRSDQDPYMIQDWFFRHAPDITVNVMDTAGQEDKGWSMKGVLGVTQRDLPANLGFDLP